MEINVPYCSLHSVNFSQYRDLGNCRMFPRSGIPGGPGGMRRSKDKLRVYIHVREKIKRGTHARQSRARAERLTVGMIVTRLTIQGVWGFIPINIPWKLAPFGFHPWSSARHSSHTAAGRRYSKQQRLRLNSDAC